MLLNAEEYKPIDSSILHDYNAHRETAACDLICHAPFKSLRFSQSGNVLACCFNRGEILGSFPAANLHDIWFGSQLADLRQSLVHKDLSHGCSECARRIENRLFNLSGSLQYDYLSSYKTDEYPVMLDFELNNTCNLECVMCMGENSSSIRRNREKLPDYPMHYDQNFLIQLEEFLPHIREARFSGGEPFLIPFYYQIWEKIIESNPRAIISVLTNGTVLNSTIKDLLDRGNFRIAVSMDSLKKDTYELIRKNADFDTVMANLEFFRSYVTRSENIFCLNVCPMRHNWEEMPDIVRICNERSIRLILHSVVFPPSESLWAMGSSHLNRVLKHLQSQTIVTDNMSSSYNVATYNQFIAQVQKWIINAEKFESDEPTLRQKTEKDLLLLLGNHINCSTGDYIKIISRLISETGLGAEERKNILINLMGFAPDLIIAELIHNEHDKLVERFKKFNYQRP